jgi:hypothetical protein
MIAMRRAPAILLMVLFSFSLVSPAMLVPDSDSNLPACCRRAGKHHCGMEASQVDSTSGPSLQAGRCSFFPTAHAVPVSPSAGLTGASQTVFFGLLAHPASRPQTDALCRSSYSRAGQKRGPPAFLP